MPAFRLLKVMWRLLLSSMYSIVIFRRADSGASPVPGSPVEGPETDCWRDAARRSTVDFRFLGRAGVPLPAPPSPSEPEPSSSDGGCCGSNAIIGSEGVPLAEAGAALDREGAAAAVLVWKSDVANGAASCRDEDGWKDCLF